MAPPTYIGLIVVFSCDHTKNDFANSYHLFVFFI